MFVALIIFILYLIISIVAIFFIATLFFGAPFVPSKNKTVKNIVEFSNAQEGQKVADLGAGDGRIIIAFARRGIEAHGFEINPFLVLAARRKIKKENLEDKAIMHWKSFWGADLSSFDISVIYGFSHIMARLEKKLQKELKSGAKVVASVFSFPKWKHEKKQGILCLYIHS